MSEGSAKIILLEAGSAGLLFHLENVGESHLRRMTFHVLRHFADGSFEPVLMDTMLDLDVGEKIRFFVAGEDATHFSIRMQNVTLGSLINNVPEQSGEVVIPFRPPGGRE